MNRKIINLGKIAILAAAFASTISAHGFRVDPEKAPGLYLPYPVNEIQEQLTPAPDGYVPFHLEHYGRHGSRWLIDNKNYDVPVEQLTIAERNGKLTPLGERILGELRDIREASRGRMGELTPLGAEQHRGIARRMVRNFPEIFTDSTMVDAKSTIIIRCILSMLNETDAISAAVPGITIQSDASEHDMWYMNHPDRVRNALANRAKELYFKPFAEKYKPTGQFLSRLINDEKFAADSLDTDALFFQLFEVSLNMGSHPERRPILRDIFSDDEINNQWHRINADWFLTGGNTALTENRSAMVQRHLLRNMVESADTALLSPQKSANLRFGHETMILSLAALMNLNGYGNEINDLDELADQWRSYEIYPMACNIQMILYRPESGATEDDVLVKILLNEREMPLTGLTPVVGPYYSWKETRKAFLDRLTEPTPEQLELIKQQ